MSMAPTCPACDTAPAKPVSLKNVYMADGRVRRGRLAGVPAILPTFAQDARYEPGTRPSGPESLKSHPSASSFTLTSIIYAFRGAQA